MTAARNESKLDAAVHPARVVRPSLTRPFARTALLVLLHCVALAASCGGRALDGGTEGSVLDQQGVTVDREGGDISVSGEPGTVSPGGAKVQVTNVATRETSVVTSRPDGSFVASLDGDADDEVSVSVLPASAISDGDHSLDGNAFVLQSAGGASVLDDVRITVQFDEGVFTFGGGCNAHWTDYSVCDGALCIAEGFASTTAGCEGRANDIDGFLAEFFRSKPAVAMDDDRLTFDDGEVTLVFGPSGE